MSVRLTTKQRLFVLYYLGESNGNATDAARKAGYRMPHDQGRQLLRKTPIRHAIESKVADAAIPAEEVLARLSDHATTSLSDFIRVDKRNRVTFDFERAKSTGRLACIKKLKRGKYGWEIELYDAQAALEKLGKYHGLFDRIILDKDEDSDQDPQQHPEMGDRGSQEAESNTQGT